MKRIRYPVILILLLTAAFAAEDELQFSVERFTLDNGLTFLVVERHTAPVFSGYICVGAGSAYERIGDIGTAHLLEHMMSKGSRLIGTTDYEAEAELMVKEDSVWAKIDQARRATRRIRLGEPNKLDAHLKYIEKLEAVLDSLTATSSQYVIQNEFDMLYTRNGAASFNALTRYDFTSYYVSLPSNRIELWFAMESDRLKNLVLREFFPERDVVSEERRLSVENKSNSKLFEQLIGTAFIAHPYQIYWEWQSEINNLTRDDLMRFHDMYYTPQNLTVAVVGDVRLQQVKKLAQDYFGVIPRRPDPNPIYTVELEQTGERRVELLYEANPAVFISYHKVAYDHPDDPVFQVIERLIGQGRTSRLYKSLVLDQQICLDISVDVFPGNFLGDPHASAFNIYAYPMNGTTTQELEQAIYAELDKLKTDPVGDKELQKIKNSIDAAFIWEAYSNMGLARILAFSQNLTHNWEYLKTFRNSMKAVSAEDIMRVADHYFTGTNRTVATLIPANSGGGTR
ncbi:MAG: insulinase family protein [Candidatus Zixiibacteriota bacterium]|nr:MAG: insulinase family protein [candidate division Zixibacteria bacterium]